MGVRIKLLLPLLFLVAAVGISLKAYWLPSFLEKDKDLHLHDEQAQVELLATALTDPLLSANLAQVHATLDDLLARSTHWVEVTLVDGKGRRLYPLEAPRPLPPNNHFATLKHDIWYLDTRLGTLSVVANLEPVWQEHTNRVHRLERFMLVLLVLAAGIGLLIQERLVRRPLLALADAATRITTGDFSAKLPPPGRDEVGRLINAFDTMRANVRNYQRELKHAAEQSRQSARQLAEHNALLTAVSDVQSKYITQDSLASVFEETLRQVVSVTGSAFGFVGRLEDGLDGHPFLKVVALSNAPGPAAGGLLENGRREEPELHNLAPLFGDGFKSGNAVIANDPGVAPLGDLLPTGYPPLSSFLGLPIRDDGGPSWMIGVANREGGYEEKQVQALRPLLQAVTNLVNNRNMEHRRRVAEQALREERDRAQRYLDTAEIMLLALDPEGRISLINRKGCELLGYREPELLGKNWFETCLPPNVRDSVYQVFRQLMTGETELPETYENPVVTKTGEERLLAWHHSLLTDTGGRITGVLSSGEDITSRRKSEYALQRFRVALDSSADSIYLIDRASMRFIDANRSAWEGLGYTREELLTIGPHDIKPEYSEERLADLFDRIIEQGGQGVVETVHRRKDGSTYPVEIHLHSLTSDGGPIITAAARDITVRKQIEEALTRARDAALKTAELKTQFLANMSHEIRTPMNGVLGMLDLLQRGDLDSEQRQLVEIAVGSGETLLALLNDILDLAKSEAGKVELEWIEFDLRSAVNGVVELMAQRAGEKNVDLGCLISPDLPSRVQGDPTRLKQVLTNLLGNAIKFTERGEILVQVSVMPGAGHSAGVGVRFDVTDTGIGIPEEVQTDVFDIFTQADGSTTRKYGGTGLGLAISRQLVEAMGGEIGVMSEPGRGSTFWFTVYFDSSGDDSTGPSPIPEADRLRFLIVDDSAISRLFLQHVFSGWGVQHDSAADAAEALALMRAGFQTGQPYDAVFLDKVMPGMDGLELARRIKGDPRIAGTTLIMISKLNGHNDKVAAREAGIACFITKPVRQSQLRECLNPFLGTETPIPLASEREARPEMTAREDVRILVAEDNPVNQMVAVGMLRQQGYQVDVVDNGERAVAALGHTPYDLVLMDVQMPVLDGYEATRRIRAVEGKTRHTPIVAMTANVMRGDRERCLESGMDDYLAKPLQAVALWNKLAHWLDAGIGKEDTTAKEEKPMTDEVATMDIAALASLKDMMGEMFNDLLDAFLGSAKGYLATLREALNEGDKETLRKTAHTLKGSSANIGAQRLAQLSARLEALARDGGEGQDAGTILTRLETEYTAVETILQEHR